MGIVKVIRNTQGGEEYLRKLCGYSMRGAVDSCGIGVDYTNPVNAFEQMLAVKQHFYKEDYNPLVHIVVDYNKNVNTPERAGELTRKIVDYFKDTNQVLATVHERDERSFHTHMVINSTNYNDGKLMQTGRPQMNKLCKFIDEVTGERNMLVFFNNSPEKK